MPIFTDQTQYPIELREIPRRIISIVPSQSELLWDLGLKDHLVGISKFCIHPEEMFRTVTRVGGTKNLNLDKIRELKPDLIIGNREENEKSQIEILRKEFKVWMSDIYDFEDAFKMMTELGRICGKELEAKVIVEKSKNAVSEIEDIFNGESVCYFIWKDPYMLAARQTFIDHLISQIGFRNCASHLSRYPVVSIDDLREMNPAYCFLSSEPYPFKEEQKKELQHLLPAAKIVLVDGELFSWYGSRMMQLPQYMNSLKIKLYQ